VLTRGVFRRQVPFVGVGGFLSSAPIPRPPQRLRDVTTAGRRSHVVLGLRRSCPVQFGAVRPSAIPFADARTDALAPVCAPARPLFTPTATLFESAAWERIRGQVPPADFCNCLRRTGHKPELSFPRRDEGLDLLPFLTPHARPLRVAPESGETRRAAHVFDQPGPGAGSSRLREFARPRYRINRATVKWQDVHGSLGVSEGRVLEHGDAQVFKSSACAFAHADDVPLLWLPEDTLCRRCARSQRKRPAAREYGPA